MKLRSIFILIALCTISLLGHAQQDPAVTSLTIAPSTISVGNTFTVVAQIGNSGSTPITGVGYANRMAFTISLNDGVSIDGGITNVTGPDAFLHFDMSYNIADHTIEGIQKEGTAIPANTVFPITITGVAQAGNLTAIANVIPNPSAIRGRQNDSNDDEITQAALPVTLTQFNVKREGNNASLQWQTTDEVNSDRFEILRSNDSKNWSAIGTVDAQQNSIVLQSYQYLDLSPENGTNYYRLKMIDLDGSFEMSHTISIQFEGLESIVMSPNPVVTRLTIRGTSTNEVEKVELRNTAGQILYQSNVLQEIDMQQLPTGMYIVAITKKGGKISAHKVIKR